MHALLLLTEGVGLDYFRKIDPLRTFRPANDRLAPRMGHLPPRVSPSAKRIYSPSYRRDFLTI